MKHRSLTPFSPHDIYLLQSASVEDIRAIEHHWRRKKQKNPIKSRHITDPRRFHEKLFHWANILEKDHVDGPNNESGYRDKDGEHKPYEYVALIAAQSHTSFVFDGRIV
jgi:hypothetical protein